jgi:dienelactone hydrolase
VHYSIDGALPANTPEDDASQTLALAAAYPKFKAAQAGILNGQYALEYVLAKLPQVNPEKIYSAGHSSAGTLSLLLAAHEPRIKACIAYAAVTDLPKRELGQLAQNEAAQQVFPGIADFIKQYSPVIHVAKLRCPTFLFHAQDDSNEPIANAQEFARLLEQNGNKPTFAEVSTGNHFDSMIQQGIPQAITWIQALPSMPAAVVPPSNPTGPLPGTPPQGTPLTPNAPAPNPPGTNPPGTSVTPQPTPGLNEVPNPTPTTPNP